MSSAVVTLAILVVTLIAAAIAAVIGIALSYRDEVGRLRQVIAAEHDVLEAIHAHPPVSQ